MSLYRHRKGGLYRVVAEAAVEKDMSIAVVYRCVKTGALFIRPKSEFFDGRFTRMDREDFDPAADIMEFHERFGLEYRDRPRALPKDLQVFRTEFIEEELNEYRKHSQAAINAIDQLDLDGTPSDDQVAYHLAEALDALVDLAYVTLGSAYLHGFDFREAWHRVHTANMQKKRAQSQGESKRGSTFDVVKPAGWRAPNHLDLVSNHAHHRIVEAAE